MKTRDGTVLRADVFRPDLAGRLPAIVLRTPYDKRDRHSAAGNLGAVTAAAHGYAFVVQDVRGRWASDGEYKPITRQEGPDGYDCIEWVASEPWCDGNVGMIGGSYESLTQFQAAEEQPPSLRAIIPQKTGSNIHRAPMMLDSILLGWAASQAMDWVNRKMATGEATQQDLDTVMTVLRDPQRAATHLPLDDMPLMRIPSLPTYQEMVDLLGSADVWRYERVQVPALIVSSWYDMDPGGAANIFRELRGTAATTQARDETKILFGPWDHGSPNVGLGERFFGLLGDAEEGGVIGTYLRFFARHLRGDDSAEAGVATATYFVMGANEWKHADDWPPPGTVERPLYLRSGGRLAPDAPTAREEPDTYRYDPADPTPSFGGRYFYMGGSRSGPFDQSRLERRPDVLVYTSEPLDAGLEVVGNVVVDLAVSSSAVDTDFLVKLCDVDPTGLSHNIADEIFRARWRDGYDTPAFLEPGAVYRFRIDLGAVGNLFGPGHCIRLQIASSAFPAYDRNMNTGNPVGVDAVGVVAEQTVYHDPEFTSRVILPVQPR